MELLSDFLFTRYYTHIFTKTQGLVPIIFYFSDFLLSAAPIMRSNNAFSKISFALTTSTSRQYGRSSQVAHAFPFAKHRKTSSFSIVITLYIIGQFTPKINRSICHNTNGVMTMNHRLRELRKEKGYTQIKMQHLTGIDQSDYSKIENGKRYYSFEQCRRIAIALNTSMDYLAGLTDEKAPYPRGKDVL